MKKTWAVIVAILVIGGGLVGWQLIKSNHKANTAASTQNSQSSRMSNMSDMQMQFEAYKGEGYDKVFLASMITHHQGAVQMAQMALANAKHQELKDLANNIISAQNSEISQMQAWRTAWDYSANDSTTQKVVKQMQGEMDGMMSQLRDKTGDDFDKAFLEQMIMHHQSAIDMAMPAATNASHQDVKTLASNIISAQTKEVNEMKSWQQQWGYVGPSSSSSSDMSGMKM